MRLLLLIFGLFTLAAACKKENDPVPPVVTPTPFVEADPPQYETPFANIPSTSDIALYEINERAFSKSGDLAGILPRLDSIRALGINVIWLMPIHPIGVTKTVNSPYCISDYRKVNPEYGNLENLRTLVREAHKRDIAVILDWAANHTSWDHPWLSQPSWYTRDANGTIIHPAGTNWQDVADLDFSNQNMRKAMISALKYWILTANIDGYRCDAADFVPFDFWKQAIDSLQQIPNRKLILLAEGARSNHFQAGFQMNFAWDYFNTCKQVFKNGASAAPFKTAHTNEYAGIPQGSHKMRFTSNHDECAWDDTPLGLFGGKAGSLSAFVITAFMGGVPLIYNGQEVGCSVKLPFFSRSPIDWTTNPDMWREYKRLMALRAAHPALRTGDLETYSNADMAAFKRKSGTDEVLVIANTRSAVKTFAVPAALNNSTWKDASSGAQATLQGNLTLNPHQYLIFKK